MKTELSRFNPFFQVERKHKKPLLFRRGYQKKMFSFFYNLKLIPKLTEEYVPPSTEIPL